MKIRNILMCALLMGVLAAAAATTWGQERGAVEGMSPAILDRPWETIEVAIVLDTSGSMEPLIDAARLKLWEIIYDLTRVEPTPRLRVALLTYGNRNHGYKAGWVKVETDLTEDLDRVSERLFALSTGAGGEYVARALQAASQKLSWTPSEDSLKLLFIAGNESADQDPKVNFREMGDAARLKGIFVVAIFCGQTQNPHAETWRELAVWSEGRFANIDLAAGTMVVRTPFDEELAKLSTALNETFLPLGKDGRKRLARMAKQDDNAEKLDLAVAASRAQVKASRLFSSGWDLVDGVDGEKVALHELPESELPKNLQRMTPSERELVVEEMHLRREEVRQRIAELSAKRAQFVIEHIEAEGLQDVPTFDTVVRHALREQLEAKGFHIPLP